MTKLKNLILLRAGKEGKYTTLGEYLSRMPEGQKAIYYACGETVDRIALLPQVEAVEDRGYEVLYLTDDVDEFALRMLDEYEGKKFKSINASDAELDTDVDKEKIEKQSEDFKDVLTFVKESF